MLQNVSVDVHPDVHLALWLSEAVALLNSDPIQSEDASGRVNLKDVGMKCQKASKQGVGIA